MKKIVIFASGSGSNAENIITYFQEKKTAEVVLVLSNKRTADVLNKATNLGVSVMSFNKVFYSKPEYLKALLKTIDPDIIVLAGFLQKFPEELISVFKDKIINIHPALLPKYGGKGMYGIHVHRAVVENKEKESGITIHYVNENYDEGNIIFQAEVPLIHSDSPEEVADKIHKLEMKHFPVVIEKILYGKL